METGTVSLYRLVFVASKWAKFIVGTTVIVCVATAVILLLLPNWYTATTSILPAQRESSFAGLTSSILQSVGLAGGQEMVLPAFATPSHVYASILKSRTVVEAVVEKRDLVRRYKSKTMDEAVTACLSHTRVKVGPEGIVTLRFEDTDKRRAADVANSFVEELNRINQKVSSSRARNTRIFMEERLSDATRTLEQAEDTLRGFQERNKAISLDEQMKAQIQNVAVLEGKLAMAEIELGLLRRTFTPDHPEIARKQMEISEVKRKIGSINTGTPGSRDYGTLALPFAQMPRLALEYGRLLRDVKIQETLFGLLTEQHEQAKIQEAKDTPTIQILDVAKVPEKKSRPKRLIILAIAGCLGAVFSMLYAAGFEYLQTLKETRPGDWETLTKSKSQVLDDAVSLWQRARTLVSRRR
ncbi:MAG: Wzz/FepE/Etk N-terminal domain-containing protein [Candidatus Eisenbacteria bacterium]|nr:Wzz/FepE/Etk N-terminal domain-containing protein [Candidatus Eisenbacteria bacterium]